MADRDELFLDIPSTVGRCSTDSMEDKQAQIHNESPSNLGGVNTDPIIAEQGEIECDQSEESMVLNARREPNRRRKVLILIILNLVLQIIIIKTNEANQAALVLATNFIHCMQFVISICLTVGGRFMRLHRKTVSRIEHTSPFVDRTILSSHSEKEFKRRLRVKPSTFVYICSLLAPALQKKKGAGGGGSR
ncbi:unnamed protein product [Calypogeia fissa]